MMPLAPARLSITIDWPSSRSRCGAITRAIKDVLANPDASIAYVKQRTIVRCNQRYAEIFGVTETAQIVGASSSLAYADHAAFTSLGQLAYPVMATGATYRTELQMRRINGDLFWATITGKLVNPSDPEEGSIWIVDDQKNLVRAAATTASKATRPLQIPKRPTSPV